MQLYKLLFEHWSQKDSEKGIKGYFVAENDEAAYEFVKSCEKLGYENLLHLYTSWEDFEEWNGYYEPDEDEVEEGEDVEPTGFPIYNDEWEQIGMETFKERMIRIGGEMFDDEHDLSDLYYGETRYGWELVGDIRADQCRVLKDLGILK